MTAKSFETILYSITASAVAKIMEMNGWTEDESMERFTASKLYSYLEREETKVWHYSAYMLATLFNEEQKGKLVLPGV